MTKQSRFNAAVGRSVQWMAGKGKEFREKHNEEIAKRGKEIAISFNTVDLAEEEAQNAVDLEIQSGRIEEMRSQFLKSKGVRGNSISGVLDDAEGDPNEELDSFQFEPPADHSPVVLGSKVHQKGMAGMDLLMDESISSFSRGDVADRRRSRKMPRPSLMIENHSSLPEPILAAIRAERVKEWASRFRQSDPRRHQIMSYFDDVAVLGVAQIAKEERVEVEKISPILKYFCRSPVFTVWRPTSLEAIRKMMMGKGVGKGLNIKGKSATRGPLSGFVPFLQLYDDRDKTKIRTLPKKSSMRIFFSTEEARDQVAEEVAVVGQEMLEGYDQAQKILADPTASDEDQENAIEKFMWEMDDPEIVILDEYAQSEAPLFGIEIPQRLFWEAFVMRRDINREPGSKHDIGRPSRPAFQDMNFASLRSHPKDGKPRAVVYQYESEDPMDARNLVVAYEDNDRILPVVSDFDCLLVGTRSVSYKEPLPDDQIQLVHWCLTNIESILEAPLMPNSWTERWLEVLKETPMKTKMPPYGFGDPTSYSVIKVAIERLNKDGCVRHGAECFNYYFPQELDDHFLIIGEGMNENGPPNWKYVSVAELQKILLKKVKEGYSFPLNPKWVLCDPGWKEIFDEQFKSESQHVKDSLDSWCPPSSGIRETIQRIAGAHPNGFQRFRKRIRRMEK